MTKRTWPLAVVLIAAVLLPVLSGCNANAPEIPKDEFSKEHPMPPEAQKGMADAMKRRTEKPPANH